MQQAGLLRAALFLNALFSSGTGLLLVLSRASAARLFEVPPGAVASVGGGLVAYGALLMALAAARRPASPWAVLATVLDLAWVALSVGFVGFVGGSGAALVVGVAVIVLLCALLQLAGLRAAIFRSGRGQFEVERLVAAPASDVWPVVADLEGYAAVAGTLHSSVVVSGEGVGLVRRCEDKQGVCWTETCTRWEPGRAYSFEVDTSAPGYPLPLRTMRGDFEVDPVTGDTSLVRIRFAFEARGGAGTELLLALTFAASGDRLVGAILRRWQARIERRALMPAQGHVAGAGRRSGG